MSERPNRDRLDEAYFTLANHHAMLQALQCADGARFISRNLRVRIESLTDYLQEQIVVEAESIQRMLEGDDLPF